MKFVHRLFHPGSPQPDQPRPFGFNQTWCTLSAMDMSKVAAAFNLTDVQPCTWNDGLRRASHRWLFVSPPVQNWIFVVGQPVALRDERSLIQQLPPLLNHLSTQFGTAHFFSTHRVPEYHVWARSEGGTLVRGYAYLGERGETLWDEGAASTEAELGLAFFDERIPDADDPMYWNRADLQFPDEETVMQMARRWCLAPIDLSPSDSPPARGLCGVIIQ